ncbi:hypothetical protein DUNSADRAFT_6924 [Dunaliella salina]|uniref:Encoded protein n=1 Tax=Dunaliella salina TaxID=3046 RepID=A0ABQ7GM98_DUNSA|nr:hypothetical protein DUNSADRAFT_6924 [Dunaliella salina]|eukprot:KAF5835743.1 hypothetical protein DUNSADRAFT_6924 [Dunaliella salina]
MKHLFMMTCTYVHTLRNTLSFTCRGVSGHSNIHAREEAGQAYLTACSSRTITEQLDKARHLTVCCKQETCPAVIPWLPASSISHTCLTSSTIR